MKLIVEAGSSKSDWVILSKHSIIRFQHIGINPTSNPGSENFISRLSDIPFKDITEVYYYGAGTSSSIAKTVLNNIFSSLCPLLGRCEIKTDMEAAARAVHKDGPCIVTILGTGSNAILYDGHKIIKKIPATGYLFGDYGSGFAIGKYIVGAFINKEMNQEDRIRFEYSYENLIPDLLHHIYSNRRPNYEIAKFSKFLNVASAPFKDKVLETCFNQFILNSLSKIENSFDYKLNFVGSIAYYFSSHLKACCESYGYQVEKIYKSPLENLIEFHKAN